MLTLTFTHGVTGVTGVRDGRKFGCTHHSVGRRAEADRAARLVVVFLCVSGRVWAGIVWPEVVVAAAISVDAVVVAAVAAMLLLLLLMFLAQISWRGV